MRFVVRALAGPALTAALVGLASALSSPALAQGQAAASSAAMPSDPARMQAMPNADALAVNELPGWHRDGLVGLAEALTRQCAASRPPESWRELCVELPGVAQDMGALRRWIESRFLAWPLVGAGGDPVGLITGYHEPLLTGSRQREHPGQVPLYRRPANLVASGTGRVLAGARGSGPFPARAVIESTDLLAGQELVWLDDPVEAFFLHVQGSGRVQLRDGSLLRVGFADHNGHAYRAIGAELVARGAMSRDEVDAPKIKAWLRAHPEEARAVMHSNPRYVFFREIATPADAGPPGSLGVPLTPMRSVATDPGFVPPGALLYLETRYPDDGRPLARAVLSQDRGAAIVGGVRADVFFGGGEDAARLAGAMKEPGRLWLLWPREAGRPTRPR